MSDLYPVLVADLTDDGARDALAQVAQENGAAWVPLLGPPANASRHLLEVYTPGVASPLRLLADPLGPSSDKGFALRLSPAPDDAGGEDDETGAYAKAPASAPAAPPPASAPAAPPPARADTPTAHRPRADTPTALMLRTNAAPPSPLELPPEQEAELAGEPVADPAAGALVGRSLAGGKLVIESLIGEGSMGAVYRARHRELRIPVAVKVLHSSYQRDLDFGRRFYAEALAISRLDHTNLVRVYDFGQEPDGLLYLAMEFLAGRSLRAVIQHEAPVAPRRIAKLMKQVCGALGHAHARGIVHRDVKPDNVVLIAGQDDDGHPVERVKVCDFGLALLRTADAARERFAGTPVYMSPEQCRGDELDARTDVYACGIMMYELATGQVPFLSDKPIVVINRHLSMPAPLIKDLVPDVDPRLDAIVQKALSKNREQRHESVRELRAELSAMLAPPPQASAATPEARPASSPPPPSTAESGPMSIAPPVIPAPPFPSVSIAPPAPRESRAPAWLEDKTEGYARFLETMASGAKPSADLAETLATDPSRWLARLADERDEDAFAQSLAELEGAVRVLAHRADARALLAVSSTLHVLSTDSTQAPGPRKERAAALLRAFADPALLGPVAERLLSPGDEASDAASRLIVSAGTAGAYALYGARVKLAAEPSVRRPFVETTRALGERAWPVVRAALARIPDAALTGEHPLAADLAEDLLLCAPSHESVEELARRFVRATSPGLARAAAGVLARLGLLA